MASRNDASHWAVAVTRAAFVLRIRLRFAVIGLRVAVDAGHVRVIRRIDVAIRANRAVMRQAPVGRVVKSRVQPTGGVVAGGAGRRKSCCNMIWYIAAQSRRALPCRGVATVAIRRQIPRIVVIHVARRAGSFGWISVRACQRESCRAVVKLSGGPRRDRMARRAHCRRAGKACRNVVWNRPANRGCALPGGGMAAHAIRRVQRVIVADMARRAGRRGR